MLLCVQKFPKAHKLEDKNRYIAGVPPQIDNRHPVQVALPCADAVPHDPTIRHSGSGMACMHLPAVKGWPEFSDFLSSLRLLWDPAGWSVSSPTPEWLFDIFCNMHGISKDERKNYYLTPNLTSTGTKTFVVNENVKTMKLKLVATDIDIDSDNDNGLAMPDENSDEEKLEDEPDHPGKAIAINGLDRDKDAVPDFADGYNIDHGEDDQSDSDNGDEDQSGSDNGDGDQSGTDKSHDFVPVVLKFSDSIPLNEATVKFKCRDLSDPDKVSREGDGSAEKPYKYSIDDGGRVRLWRKNGSEAREKAQVPSGDAILHNTEVRLDKLDTDGDRRVELYLEGLAGSSSLGDINIKAEVDPDGPDGSAPYLCQDSIKATVFYVDSVHPQASDFEDGEEGKVMISTEQDDKYYTKQDTTKAGKPAQTSDGEVTISAYIKPKPPEDYSGVTTYFEVTDPDDLSHYEGKSSPGDPSEPGDEKPNDNRDLNKRMFDPAETDSGETNYGGYQVYALSDLSAPVELSTIDSSECAVAETTLNITDHCSGDNYQVRATLRNPQDSPFDTLSGGEKMAAALAIRLAVLEQLAAIGVAFLDEPTANLDARKKQNLVTQLESLDQLDQLGVVSHDRTFESMTERTVELEKDDQTEETRVVS